ncbi:nuclear transport factor 2 family protein [Spirosoma linguale]|uniref:SnoaL-like domain-containing protein n=1 Tax=Spirosoma linguale (strain ATCC 33905 / DSM 74 / LMG 10896 / Claus 1) TaxID=504472 RepID=D2QKG9_SPILD|nr:protein of unknown function DUF1486 [Spirosoma linguale DSM 74]
MKILFRFPLVAIAAGMLFIATTVQAQTSPTRYKDVVVENPNAEADMKVVGDLLDALLTEKLDKARSLMAANYMDYGPGYADSANTDQVLKQWTENYKSQKNRKVSSLMQTFRVKSGPQKGDWVSIWMTYTATFNGKPVVMPLYSVLKLADGKVVWQRDYFDNMAVATQLGYKVSPPNVTAK